MCVLERETGGWLSGDNEITHGSFDIIGKVLRKTSS